MSSTDSPPSYFGSTAVREKSTQSTAYHLTLERCKQTVKLDGGRMACSGFLDDLNIAINISPTHTWSEVREQIWDRFQVGWPAILGKADMEEYAMGISMQYYAEDGEVRGRVYLLENEETALWELCKRGSINVIRFVAHCSPCQGEAIGTIRERDDSFFEENCDLKEEMRKRSSKKTKGERKHHCSLQ